MNTTIARYRRYGELKLASDIVDNLISAEPGEHTPLWLAYLFGG